MVILKIDTIDPEECLDLLSRGLSIRPVKPKLPADIHVITRQLCERSCAFLQWLSRYSRNHGDQNAYNLDYNSQPTPTIHWSVYFATYSHPEASIRVLRVNPWLCQGSWSASSPL